MYRYDVYENSFSQKKAVFYFSNLHTQKWWPTRSSKVRENQLNMEY